MHATCVHAHRAAGTLQCQQLSSRRAPQYVQAGTCARAGALAISSCLLLLAAELLPASLPRFTQPQRGPAPCPRAPIYLPAQHHSAHSHARRGSRVPRLLLQRASNSDPAAVGGRARDLHSSAVLLTVVRTLEPAAVPLRADLRALRGRSVLRVSLSPGRAVPAPAALCSKPTTTSPVLNKRPCACLWGILARFDLLRACVGAVVVCVLAPTAGHRRCELVGCQRAVQRQHR